MKIALSFYLGGSAVWALWCCACNRVFRDRPEMRIPLLGIVVQSLLWPLLAVALFVLGVIFGAI